MNRMCVSCLLAALSFYADTSNAATVYSQTLPAKPTGAFGSQDTPSGQKVADNFVFQRLDSVTVHSVRFIGGYGFTNPPPITPPLDALPVDNFRITFLQDSGGVPGLPVLGGEFVNANVIYRSPTNGPLLSGAYSPIDYAVDLGDGISLSPNTNYWLAITNDTGPTLGWLWARAAGVFDQNIASTFGNVTTGPWSDSANGGMYFELNDQNVPEPMTLIILVTGAVSALVNSRQRLEQARGRNGDILLFRRRKGVRPEWHQVNLELLGWPVVVLRRVVLWSIFFSIDALIVRAQC